jgi:hypothetical protein
MISVWAESSQIMLISSSRLVERVLFYLAVSFFGSSFLHCFLACGAHCPYCWPSVAGYDFQKVSASA